VILLSEVLRGSEKTLCWGGQRGLGWSRSGEKGAGVIL